MASHPMTETSKSTNSTMTASFHFPQRSGHSNQVISSGETQPANDSDPSHLNREIYKPMVHVMHLGVEDSKKQGSSSWPLRKPRIPDSGSRFSHLVSRDTPQLLRFRHVPSAADAEGGCDVSLPCEVFGVGNTERHVFPVGLLTC